jgi:hypothetical protein
MRTVACNQTRDALNELASGVCTNGHRRAFVGIDLMVNGATWIVSSIESRTMLAPIAK